MPLSDVVIPRHEPLRVTGALGDWQAITIKFSGEVLPRARTEAFKGAMFAAHPGDLVFSKIDARNGAVGLIPESISKAVVTSEYPVFVPRVDKLRPDYLHHVLRAEHFRADLRRKATGTSGRKRVTPEGFLDLKIPVPSLDEQDALIRAYTDALTRATQLEQEAEAIERAGWQAFETALGVAPPPPLPDRPVFVARFKDVERWSHESILRSSTSGSEHQHSWSIARLGDLVVDLENGWSPKCHDHPAREGKWGVLKLGAVSFGKFDATENKELPTNLKPRPEYEVKDGDVLIREPLQKSGWDVHDQTALACFQSLARLLSADGSLLQRFLSRANVVRYVGACAYVESTPPHLMLCDKIFRVRFRSDSKLLPRFLAEAMKLRSVREQIESRLTGTSPTMKNISKPSLLGLEFPLPDIKIQQQLIEVVASARASATAKRSEAASLRQSAWVTFESALFTVSEETTA